MIEAGHVTQNINLTCTAMKLRTINLGGFYDREIDKFLGFDGMMQSTIYVTAIGGDDLIQGGRKEDQKGIWVDI